MREVIRLFIFRLQVLEAPKQHKTDQNCLMKLLFSIVVLKRHFFTYIEQTGHFKNMITLAVPS